MEPPARQPRPPIYYQIARALESRIYHGLYRPGAAIPSEIELSREFGVTRLTVRQAFQQLIAQGLLVPRRGSGTYVADQPQVLRPVNFLGYLDDQWLEPRTMDVELRRVEEMLAPHDVRERLRLSLRARVLLVERIRRLDGYPINRALSYLPRRIGRRLPLDKLTQRSLVELLREYGGVAVPSATQRLTAEAASDEVAERLQLAAGAPVLRSDFLVADGNTPITCSVVHYRPDRTFFTASLISVPSPTTRSLSPRLVASGSGLVP